MQEEDKTVDIDTSGPDVEVELPQEKKENEKEEVVKELMASGAIDSMERYQYMLGLVRTYESLLQEISTLLNKKEQNDSKGTIISIKAKNNNTK